jgi:hypothetical protein
VLANTLTFVNQAGNIKFPVDSTGCKPDCTNKWDVRFATSGPPGNQANLWWLGSCPTFDLAAFRALPYYAARVGYVNDKCSNRWTSGKLLVSNLQLTTACTSAAACVFKPQNPIIMQGEAGTINQRQKYYVGQILVVETNGGAFDVIQG